MDAIGYCELRMFQIGGRGSGRALCCYNALLYIREVNFGAKGHLEGFCQKKALQGPTHSITSIPSIWLYNMCVNVVLEGRVRWSVQY